MHCFPRVYSRGLARAAFAWKKPEKEGKKTGVSVLALHSHIKCKVNQRLFVFRGAALAAAADCKYFPFFFPPMRLAHPKTRREINHSILASR
jgi:hypothetical protein